MDNMDGKIIGTYDDIRHKIFDALKKAIANKDDEQSDMICGLIDELHMFLGTDKTLVLDDHDGMGYTITEYNN